MSLHHRLRMVSSGGGPAPSFIGVATGFGSGSASVTPHASTASGDLLVAIVHCKDTNATNSVTWPSGFTEIFDRQASSGFGYSDIYLATKTATGSEGSLTFTFNAFSGGGVSIFTVRDWTAAISVYGAALTTASSTTVAAASISPTKSALLIGIASGFDAAKTWTAPASMAELYDFDSGASGGQRCAAAYETVSSGATGTRTFTFSGSDDLSAILVAVE